VIKVVVDTNIYFSALLFGGVPDEVVDLGRQEKITIFISPSILKEIEGILLRKSGWDTERIEKTIVSITGFTQSVDPQEKIDVIKGDGPDNRVLECAVEAKADVIVSGDKRHLLKLKTFRGVKIQTPSEFLKSQIWLPESEK
jgi:putative PIN family toxin of toxin-antitoxin system